MNVLENHRQRAGKLVAGAPFPATDVAPVAKLLARCPAAAETPLVVADGLAPVGTLWVKDERGRINLGSFKSLGAAYVIARDAVAVCDPPGATTLAGRTYVTASAGNHGMSVAAGARVFGARAVVYIAETVPEAFAGRLAGQGAVVHREGADYAASIAAAGRAAEDNGWTLLSDGSWEGYTDIPHVLMQGYLQIADEAARQCPEPPTHLFLQAGVGGLAGSFAAFARSVWGDGPKIVVVEPENAPALQASIKAGAPVFADGSDSVMGRLDCKEPSHIALNGLARDADAFATLSDCEVLDCLPRLAEAGLETTASGAAGLAAVMHPQAREAFGLDPASRILTVLSEGSE